MKCLTRDEMNAWCQSRGMRIDEGRWIQYETPTVFRLLASTEIVPARLIALGGALVPFWNDDLVEDFEGALLWFREWGIWEDHCEAVSYKIVEQLRRARGETRPLEESPAQLFGPSELTDMHTFLSVPLLFGWDAYMAPENRDYLVRVSHDSYVEVVSRTAEADQHMRRCLGGWDLRTIADGRIVPLGELGSN